MSSPKHLILFPDSNLFFQYRALHELPWNELGDYGQIELIVSRPVQKEIDRHKGGGNDRRQRRARQAASVLREIIKNKLTPHDICSSPQKVTLTLRVDLKPDEGLAGNLNYAEPDDILVGIAHGFADSVMDADVAVLTDDTGVMASAEAVSLNYIAIPDEWRLEPEGTKESKELNAARAEIARLQKQEPAFIVKCFDADGRSASSLEYQFPKASPLTPEEIATLLDRARLLFPLKADFNDPVRPASVPGRRGISLESLRGLRSPPTEQQIVEYNQAYETWLAKIETALKKVHLKLLQDETKNSFSFLAQNIGTRPANDVLVEIVATGSLLIGRPSDEDDENEYSLPAPPAVPEFQLSALNAMLRMSNMFGPRYGMGRELEPIIDTRLRRGRDAEAFYYNGDPARIAKNSLKLECVLWRHGKDPENFHAVVDASTAAEVKGVIEFRIHASNLSNAVSCRIPVRITFKAFSTIDYASKLIDALKPITKNEGQ